MSKLSKSDYVLNLAKLYGLQPVEIYALQGHLNETLENPYLEKRFKSLFEFYEKYSSSSEQFNFEKNKDGVIILNEFEHLSSSNNINGFFARKWLINLSLEKFLQKKVLTSETIPKKQVQIARANSIVIPQVAKDMGLEAATYYRAQEKDGNNIKIYYITPSFVKETEGEEFISGENIVEPEHNKKKVNIHDLLSDVDRYVKHNYKFYGIPEERMQQDREEIRRTLIKHSFFNKFVLEYDESNKNFGLIKDKDGNLRLAPRYDVDYCVGVKNKNHHFERVIGKNKSDIASFMQEFKNEKWFRNWLSESALKLDINTSILRAEQETGVTLNKEEKEFYAHYFSLMKDEVKRVIVAEFPEGNRDDKYKYKTRKKDYIKDKLEEFSKKRKQGKNAPENR